MLNLKIRLKNNEVLEYIDIIKWETSKNFIIVHRDINTYSYIAINEILTIDEEDIET